MTKLGIRNAQLAGESAADTATKQQPKKSGKKAPKKKKAQKTVKEIVEREQATEKVRPYTTIWGPEKEEKPSQAIPIQEFKAKPEVDAYWDSLLSQILNGKGHFKFEKNEIPASMRPSDGHKIYQKHGCNKKKLYLTGMICNGLVCGMAAAGAMEMYRREKYGLSLLLTTLVVGMFVFPDDFSPFPNYFYQTKEKEKSKTTNDLEDMIEKIEKLKTEAA